MKETFRKRERLGSPGLIARLFREGNEATTYPLRLIYLHIPRHGKQGETIRQNRHRALIQVAFSVPRKNFPKATDRNRVKRLMREAYRRHKHILLHYFKDKRYAMMLIYLDKVLPDYPFIENKILLILQRFVNEDNF